MKPFKIRCSAISQIMTNPRSKGEILSETSKTYCENWAKEQIYARRIEIASKYMQKGVECEANSIAEISRYYGQPFEKNEQYFEDDFTTGTPDIITSDTVIDVKNSWDFTTFPLFETDPPKQYVMQLQGYMHLTGRHHASLIFALSDMPESLIEREAWAKARREGVDFTPELLSEMTERYTYMDIADKFRFKRYDFDFDVNFVASVIERVELCRNYINSII